MIEKNKIVLCEDELIISLDLRRILKKLGYSVPAVYKSAEELLSNIEKDKPDLVIADVNLKGNMNGIELAEILVRRNMIKVMFLTGSPVTNYREKLIELDCEYIVKPFLETVLKEKLDYIFSSTPQP